MSSAELSPTQHIPQPDRVSLGKKIHDLPIIDNHVALNSFATLTIEEFQLQLLTNDSPLQAAFVKFLDDNPDFSKNGNDPLPTFRGHLHSISREPAETVEPTTSISGATMIFSRSAYPQRDTTTAKSLAYDFDGDEWRRNLQARQHEHSAEWEDSERQFHASIRKEGKKRPDFIYGGVAAVAVLGMLVFAAIRSKNEEAHEVQASLSSVESITHSADSIQNAPDTTAAVSKLAQPNATHEQVTEVDTPPDPNSVSYLGPIALYGGRQTEIHEPGQTPLPQIEVNLSDTPSRQELSSTPNEDSLTNNTLIGAAQFSAGINLTPLPDDDTNQSHLGSAFFLAGNSTRTIHNEADFIDDPTPAFNGEDAIFTPHTGTDIVPFAYSVPNRPSAIRRNTKPHHLPGFEFINFHDQASKRQYCQELILGPLENRSAFPSGELQALADEAVACYEPEL